MMHSLKKIVAKNFFYLLTFQFISLTFQAPKNNYSKKFLKSINILFLKKRFFVVF